VSSTSSDDEQRPDHPDATHDDGDTGPQLDRSQAYKATRVFYRHRSDKQLPSEVSKSTRDANGEQLECIKPTKPPRTADHINTNNNRQTRHRNYKNNEYSNFNKFARFKNDSVAGGSTANGREKYRHYSQERRNFSNISKETAAKQQRGSGATSGGCGDNGKSKQRKETEQTQIASPKSRRQECESTESSTPVDKMRYSTNRRRWKLLPLPVAPTDSRSTEYQLSGPPPADDRRPYRRNLPPRMLARLKQNNSSSSSKISSPAAATGEPANVNVTTCDDAEGTDAEVTLQATAEVRSAVGSLQTEGGRIHVVSRPITK